jgi:tetratricopeptide (TPR) repeat protein
MTENFKELLAIGRRERQENHLSASRAIFLDVVRKAAEAGDRPSLAEALGGLAEAEDGIGNCEAARHHYANAAMLYREIGPPKALACTLRHEADLWMQANRPADAEPLYLEAEKIYRQSGEESALDLAHTLRALALIRESNKKPSH